MSLDVYLYDDMEREEKCICSECDHEHVRIYRKQLFRGTITHNLITIAEACGLYKVVWNPEEHGIEIARHMEFPLMDGLDELIGNEDKYRALQPENGFGTYDGFVKFIQRYLEACKEYPHAIVRVCR